MSSKSASNPETIQGPGWSIRTTPDSITYDVFSHTCVVYSGQPDIWEMPSVIMPPDTSTGGQVPAVTESDLEHQLCGRPDGPLFLTGPGLLYLLATGIVTVKHLQANTSPELGVISFELSAGGHRFEAIVLAPGRYDETLPSQLLTAAYLEGLVPYGNDSFPRPAKTQGPVPASRAVLAPAVEEMFTLATQPQPPSSSAPHAGPSQADPDNGAPRASGLLLGSTISHLAGPGAASGYPIP